MTTKTCKCEKLCHDKRKYIRDKVREEPQKECHDIVCYVATKWKARRQKYLSRHFSRGARNDKVVAIRFLWHDTRYLCHNNYYTTLADLCCDIVKLCRDRIQEESRNSVAAKKCKPRKKLGNKDKNYVTIKFSMWRQRN